MYTRILTHLVRIRYADSCCIFEIHVIIKFIEADFRQLSIRSHVESSREFIRESIFHLGQPTSAFMAGTSTAKNE